MLTGTRCETPVAVVMRDSRQDCACNSARSGSVLPQEEEEEEEKKQKLAAQCVKCASERGSRGDFGADQEIAFFCNHICVFVTTRSRRQGARWRS